MCFARRDVRLDQRIRYLVGRSVRIGALEARRDNESRSRRRGDNSGVSGEGANESAAAQLPSTAFGVVRRIQWMGSNAFVVRYFLGTDASLSVPSLFRSQLSISRDTKRIKGGHLTTLLIKQPEELFFIPFHRFYTPW